MDATLSTGPVLAVVMNNCQNNIVPTEPIISDLGLTVVALVVVVAQTQLQSPLVEQLAPPQLQSQFVLLSHFVPQLQSQLLLVAKVSTPGE